MPPQQRSLPDSWKTWSRAAKKLSVDKKSIHTTTDFNSGSNLTESELLLLRAIWPKTVKTDVVKELGLDDSEYFGKASNWLDAFTPFRQYLRGIEQRVTPGTTDMGIFGVTYAQQFEVCSLLEKDSESIVSPTMGLPNVNEEVVNSSLLSFLSACCLQHSEFKGTWTPHRANMAAEFKRGKMTCQLDGYLAANAKSQTHAILEAKAQDRWRHEPQVSMQETCEIVSAILDEKPSGLPKDRVILIAQDGREWYLSKATYVNEYRDFLKGTKKGIKKEEFLCIRRYGPWHLKKKEDVEIFAKLALAVSLRASAEQ